MSPVRRLDGEAETARLGRALAPLLGPGDVVALWGGLGTGKTVLARALIRARCGATEEVPSPTFTLVQIYPSLPPHRGEVWHFDLYRLADADEAWELGIEEAFAAAIAVIEWPDRLGRLLPEDRLDVVLCHGGHGDGPESRQVRLGGSQRWHQRLREAGLA